MAKLREVPQDENTAKNFEDGMYQRLLHATEKDKMSNNNFENNININEAAIIKSGNANMDFPYLLQLFHVSYVESPTLNAQQLLDIAAYVEQHRSELEQEVEVLHKFQESEAKEQAQIAREWRDYRNEGTGQ